MTTKRKLRPFESWSLGELRQRIEGLYNEGGLKKVLNQVYIYFRVRLSYSKLKLNILHKLVFEFKYGSGIDVTNKDWDNLIILDACRYDIFQKYSRFAEASTTRVISQGCWSFEWQKNNFVGKSLHDTIYITANGYSERIPNETFFKSVNSLIFDNGAHPSVVKALAKEAHKQHPDKKLIVHFMQPHVPHYSDYTPNQEIDIWDLYLNNKISRSELFDSYVQNLHFVEDHVEDLLRDLQGKTIISSDHGENLGELGFNHALWTGDFGLKKPLLGHGFQTKECRFVPWCELDFKSRRRTISSQPIRQRRERNENIKENLRKLGYIGD
jgi:hypothetical protein